MAGDIVGVECTQPFGQVGQDRFIDATGTRQAVAQHLGGAATDQAAHIGQRDRRAADLRQRMIQCMAKVICRIQKGSVEVEPHQVKGKISHRPQDCPSLLETARKCWQGQRP